MPSDAFCRWAAESLLDRLRSGDVPDDLNPGDVAWHPMTTVLRAAIGPDDHDLARRLAARPETVMWGALLARRFLADEDLTQTLLQAFLDETDVEREIGLFHHLTARPVSAEQREILDGWLQANLDVFVREQGDAFAGPDGPDRLLARIESDDPGFRAKRWVYMYSALALSEGSARSVLDRHAAGDDPVVAAAARRALTRLA